MVHQSNNYLSMLLKLNEVISHLYLGGYQAAHSFFPLRQLGKITFHSMAILSEELLNG